MSATRSLNGVELPAPGTWHLDPAHADVGFVGRHFGLTKIRGRFTGVSGTIVVAEDIQNSSIDITIDMATVSSGDQARDEHLRSADFFDSATHPTATFAARTINSSGATGTIHGDLTIKGIAKPVTLAVEYLGHATDPWGNERTVFSATTKLNREDWGLTWNMLLEAGGFLVSKEITLEIDVELIRATS